MPRQSPCLVERTREERRQLEAKARQYPSSCRGAVQRDRQHAVGEALIGPHRVIRRDRDRAGLGPDRQ